ncbi:MAG: hypothetical protein MI975_26880 [Cytophagales bacterium]|nr:hypothetical protein [Cytophagales bacterium]
MTGSKERIKRAFWTLFTSAFVFGLLFVVSCDNGNDDPEPQLYQLPGVYKFKKAILKSDLEIPGIPSSLIPEDITDQLAGGLLAEAPCDDPENGAVELKENKELFFACVGESNELKAGTWDVNNDTTELSLNLSVPQALLLPITDMEINESTDVISGTIANFPLNKTLIAGFLTALTEEQRNAILAGIAENFVVLITVDIEFQKVT